MSSHMIAICVLALMFVLATALPINMGVIAFVGAFLVGSVVAGMQAKAIMAGFPAELFLTLVGITFLFARPRTTAPSTGWSGSRCAAWAGASPPFPG